MGRPVHFEIPVDEPERAKRFYAAAFGWEFQEWEGPIEYWLITTGPGDQPGIDGALARRRDDFRTPVIIMDVRSIDEAIAKVEASGGTVTIPKTPIPGVGYSAYCLDSEGNAVGLFESDESVPMPGTDG